MKSKATKVQAAVLGAMSAKGAELIEEWGCDNGVTGTAKTRFYYQAWIKDSAGRSLRRVARRTVEALRGRLSCVSQTRGLRVSRIA